MSVKQGDDCHGDAQAVCGKKPGGEILLGNGYAIKGKNGSPAKTYLAGVIVDLAVQLFLQFGNERWLVGIKMEIAGKGQD